MGNKKVENLFYDNSTSGIVASNIQDAIDEIIASTTNLYTADGALTANRTVNGNGHSMEFNNLNWFGFYSANGNGEIEFDGAVMKIAAANGGEFELGHQDSLLWAITSTVSDFKIRSGNTDAKITDARATTKGFEYAADYSTGYTNRSLVDKEYVDTAIVNGVVNIYNSDGTISGGDRTVDIDGNSLYFDNTELHVEFNEDEFIFETDDGVASAAYSQDPNGSSYVSTHTGSNQNADASYRFNNLSFSRSDDGNATRTIFTIDPINISISSDVANFQGAVYAANYSADYTPRSLVDKEYVDGHVGSSVFDADADTGIQTERTADDDTLRFQTAGNDAMMIDNTGKVRVSSDNGSTGMNCLFEVGKGSESSTFGVQADPAYGNIATFRDQDGENVFRAKGALSSDNLEVTFGDTDVAYSGAGMIVKSGTGNGSLEVLNSELRFYQGNYSTAHPVGFKSPSGVAADHIWTLPDNDGLANQVLTTDGSHVLEFTSPTVFVNANNGITKTTSGQVSTLKLGGNLSEDTTISGDSKTYGLDLPALSYFNVNADDVFIETGAGAQLELTSDLAAITSNSGSLQTSNTKTVFNDLRSVGNRSGIEYVSDYSDDFVDRSLVDKQYVDNRTSAIQLVNQAMTTLNGSTAGTEVTWNATATHNTNIDVFTPGTNGVTVTEGIYEVYTSLYNEASSSRVNVGVEVLVNGAGQGAIGAGGYIRNLNGHKESSSSVKQIITCADGDVISIHGIRMANSGTVTTPADKSVLIINKLQ